MSDLVTRLRTYQARTIRFSPWWTDPDGKNNEQVYWKVSEVENSATMIEAADMIERLTAERDEARRMFCKCHAQAEAIGYAEGRGWDCFKEDGK
jgi:hypothetical protein